ncbi:hypothetical protein EW145_g3971 [Phellinidium pouzarii]|uniref:Uncharacterized protein n=1 Tax=Phellinidium pouzarii TaxID=167371 RepID=A0A4S4L5E5_9AGAM|nr:hypothetical protein EW145_g3971 [Phellinidium pouzarii]
MERDDHDYTEGASAIDIDYAISESQGSRHFRRDSQVGRPYGTFDGTSEGAVFDGPVNVAVPSSVSRMSHREISRERPRHLDRRSNGDHALGGRSRHLRRRSEDSGVVQRARGVRRDSGSSFVTDVGAGTEAEDGPDEENLSGVVRRRLRRRSSSPEAMRSSVFENIAHVFGRSSVTQGVGTSSRRPSLSLRSAGSSRGPRRSRPGSRVSDAGSDYAIESDDDPERWGYSSGEEDDNTSTEDSIKRGHGEIDHRNSSDIDYGSLPPSPSGSLSNMALDPVSGDTRIDMDFMPEPSNPPSTGTA